MMESVLVLQAILPARLAFHRLATLSVQGYRMIMVCLRVHWVFLKVLLQEGLVGWISLPQEIAQAMGLH